MLAPLYIFRGILLIPGINFYLPYTVLEILIVCSIIATLVHAIFNNEGFRVFKTRYDLFILILLICAFISIFFSRDQIGGLGIFKAYFVEPVLFFYCLTYCIKRTSSNFVYYAICLAGVWLSIHALIQKLTGQYSFVPVELSQGRVTAVYNSANALAMFLGPVCIIAFAKFVKNKSLVKLMYLALVCLILVVIYYTKSRGGIVAISLGLGIFIYTLITLKNKLLQKIWFIIPALLVFGMGLFIYQLYLTYNFFPIDWGKPYTKGDTLQIRYFLWAGTVNLLKDHPLSGAGLNGYKTLYTNQYRLPQYQEEFQYPHNLFLTFWSETGLYGLTAFLLIIVSSIGLIIRKIRHSKQPIYGAGLIAVLAYWLFHGVVDVPYFKNDLSLEFWMIMALINSWDS